MSTDEPATGAPPDTDPDPPGHRDHRRDPGPSPVLVGEARQQQEVLDLLDEASQRLPDETRQARWMIRERDEYLAQIQREGDDIVQAGRLQAERMVQRTEIVREAQLMARRVTEAAHEEARRLHMEAEDYCDQKLAAFEVVLDRTIKTVAAGRQKLSVTPTPVLDGPDTRVAGVDADGLLGGEDAFFDQDRPSGSRYDGRSVARPRHHLAPVSRHAARGASSRPGGRAAGGRQHRSRRS